MPGVCCLIMLLKELHNQIKTALHIFKGNTRFLSLKNPTMLKLIIVLNVFEGFQNRLSPRGD